MPPSTTPAVALWMGTYPVPASSSALPSAHCPSWSLRAAAAPVHHSAASGEPEGAICPTHAQFAPPDTEYINPEELAKVEKMLNHLSEESKQAAATTLVSPARAPALSQSLTAGLGHRTLDVTTNCPVTPTAHQRGRPVPHLLRTPHLGHLQALLPQVMQVSSSHV